MDRHVPLHCFRKHCSGAGIHAQEILEKFIRNPIGDVERLLEHIKMLKSMPCLLEEFVLKYDAGVWSLAEYLSALLEMTDEIRKMRQEALSWMPLVRTASDGDTLDVWQKDFLQELNEYAGDLWQCEKHLMEYIADIYIKDRNKVSENEVREIGKRIAEALIQSQGNT